MMTISVKESFMKKAIPITLMTLVFCAVLFIPELCFANFESSLTGIKTKLTQVILPVLSVIGLAIAAISFFTGNPQAKQRAPQRI